MGADQSVEKARQIADWHLDLMGELSGLELVEAIEARREAAAPGEDTLLAGLLHQQLVMAATELMLEADAVIDEMIERFPDDVLSPIAKAKLYLRYLSVPEKALEASEVALARAERTGLFVRHVLELQVDILRALRRQDQVERTRKTIDGLVRGQLPVTPRTPELDKENEQSTEILQWGSGLMQELGPLEAVQRIKARRRAGAPGEDRWLASELHSQLVIAAIFLIEDAEAVIDEMIERLPDDVRFPIAKVEIHRRHLAGPERALEHSEVALSRANRTGSFRREVLGYAGADLQRP